MNRRMSHPGFTLIESLAVVALLGLVFGVVGTGLLASADRQSDLDRAVSVLVQADARTRLEARRTGAQIMHFDMSRRGLFRMSVSSDNDEREQLATWSRQVRVAVLRSDERGELDVLIDRMGRSDDYMIQVAGENQTRTLAISGLTGWVSEVSAP